MTRGAIIESILRRMDADEMVAEGPKARGPRPAPEHAPLLARKRAPPLEELMARHAHKFVGRRQGPPAAAGEEGEGEEEEDAGMAVEEAEGEEAG